MLKNTFMVGPFEVRPLSGGGVEIGYGHKTLARNIYAPGETRQEIIDALDDCLARLHAEFRENAPRHQIFLMRHGEILASFISDDSIVGGMTPGLPDDRAEFWLQSENRLYSKDVTIDEYASIRARNVIAPFAWVAKLLPEEVITHDIETWRAPTAWEIRHVVGEGSFTGISGAKAAALVGISPQNFRKYTAADGASTRQNISYATWHLLLSKLGVTR